MLKLLLTLFIFIPSDIQLNKSVSMSFFMSGEKYMLWNKYKWTQKND